MKHPIDVSHEAFVDHNGKDTEAFVIHLVQEDPSYSPGADSSEHMISFQSRKALEAFCDAQGLKPVYDEDAQAVIDDGEDEPE